MVKCLNGLSVVEGRLRILLREKNICKEGLQRLVEA